MTSSSWMCNNKTERGKKCFYLRPSRGKKWRNPNYPPAPFHLVDGDIPPQEVSGEIKQERRIKAPHAGPNIQETCQRPCSTRGEGPHVGAGEHQRMRRSSKGCIVGPFFF